MAFHNPFHNTEADTLAMLMPAAEIEVMRILWAQGPLTVADVHTLIKQHRALAYTTILTTMVRLAEKGILHRKGSGKRRRHTYTPAMDERTFVMRAVHEMLDCVVRDYPSA